MKIGELSEYILHLLRINVRQKLPTEISDQAKNDIREP